MSASTLPGRRAPTVPGTAWPTAVLLFSAALWGLTWWPVKQFAQAGISAPVLSVLTYGPLTLVSITLLARDRALWAPQALVLAGIALTGGWANVAFVNALMAGEVARVMFLFYLTPVWSVLGGWLLLGERVRPRRALAVGLALAGLWPVMGGWDAIAGALLDGDASMVDLLALSAGLAFAGSNLLARKGQRIPMAPKTVAVFIGSCALSSTVLIWRGQPLPAIGPQLAGGMLAYAAIWLVLATATWQYGVTHLETGRAGVVMVAELVIGVLSAAALGHSALGPAEWLGGALITLAALIEATDTEPTTEPTTEPPPGAPDALAMQAAATSPNSSAAPAAHPPVHPPGA